MTDRIPPNSPQNTDAAYVCWINGKRYDDLIERPSVDELRRMAGVPDDHDFFAEGDHGEEDVRLPRDPDNKYEEVALSKRARFYSTPRFINAG